MPLQLERALEQRPESGVVVRLAGFDPQLLAEHRKLRQLFDQRLRQLRLPIVVALQIDDIRAGLAVPIGGERAVDQLGQPFANFGSGLLFVDQAGQMAHLLGPIFAARRRQLGPLVPAEKPLHRIQNRGFARVGAEAVVGRLIFVTHLEIRRCSEPAARASESIRGAWAIAPVDVETSGRCTRHPIQTDDRIRPDAAPD